MKLLLPDSVAQAGAGGNGGVAAAKGAGFDPEPNKTKSDDLIWFLVRL
jgi:hypothetical protein